jgi:hypothetical protein
MSGVLCNEWVDGSAIRQEEADRVTAPRERRHVERTYPERRVHRVRQRRIVRNRSSEPLDVPGRRGIVDVEPRPPLDEGAEERVVRRFDEGLVVGAQREERREDR